MLRLAIFLLTLSLMGCASYMKRKACESTDWYQHGYQYAMQGKRLDSDPFIKECREVEAKMDYAAADTGFKAGMVNYCKEDNAYNKAFAGDSFNYDFCEPNSITKLKGSFLRGRDKLCNSGAYEFGASGKVYAGQCKDNNEPPFLKKYGQGRYKYLQNEIKIAQDQIYRNDRKMRNLQYEILNLQSQKNAMGAGNVMVREKKYDELTRTYRDEVRVEKDPHVQNELDRLSNLISRKRAEADSLKSQQDELDRKIIDYRREMTKIER